VTTIGIIGAGNVGAQFARLAVANGYYVVLSNSRGPETLAALVAELGPRASAGTVLDAAEAADFALVAIPTKNYPDVPVAALAGKVVIDADNYYTDRDGHIAELDDESTTSSELLQSHLANSKVVKTLNHIYSAELVAGPPAGDKNRRALAVASDHPEATAIATKLLDEFGYDTVDAGPLAEGWRIQPGTPGYCVRQNSTELRANLAAAKRIHDS
jgi:8-hydroxy-5-deazaflavin:NADPH oxidoreductase